MEFEDAWLEVRACAGDNAAGAGEQLLEVRAISEVLEAATNANRHPGMWDYSRRLSIGDVEVITSVLALVKTAEDSRSVSHSANVSYKGSCYTLTLFAIKRNQ